MSVIVLDANAVIRHGRAFPERDRAAVSREETIVLPHSVKRELVDDVLDGNPPANHRRLCPSSFLPPPATATPTLPLSCAEVSSLEIHAFPSDTAMGRTRWSCNKERDFSPGQ